MYHMSQLVGNIYDIERLIKCLTYLSNQISSKPDYTINMNGFVQMTLFREHKSWNVVLKRNQDNCILFKKQIDLQKLDMSKYVENMVEELNHNKPFIKCLVCDQLAEHKSDYCKLCSLLQTKSNDVCPICIDENRLTAVWVQLPCHHIFHYDCMKTNMKSRSTCPLCREPCEHSRIHIY